ncbi:MAG: YggU family protein [Betaproteobacteria bacterium]|nr:YggU family protein [Betaproteobacteria bacterium]
MNGPWHREADGTLVLQLHVQPGAKRTGWAGLHGDAIKVRLAAPPVDGQANEALLRFLADTFGVPVRQVVLRAGAGSRQKRVALSGIAVDIQSVMEGITNLTHGLS